MHKIRATFKISPEIQRPCDNVLQKRFFLSRLVCSLLPLPMFLKCGVLFKASLKQGGGGASKGTFVYFNKGVFSREKGDC